MRRVRTIDKLLEYLDSVGCPIGKSTISKLIKEEKIPHIRIADRILIFDLDDIDNWLGGTMQENKAN